MHITIDDSGMTDDWNIDTLDGEVIPRVLSEKGLDGLSARLKKLLH